jgi:hypothetical protein
VGRSYSIGGSTKALGSGAIAAARNRGEDGGKESNDVLALVFGVAFGLSRRDSKKLRNRIVNFRSRSPQKRW